MMHESKGQCIGKAPPLHLYIFLFLYFFGVNLSYMQLDPSLRSVFSSVQVVTTTDSIDGLIVVSSMYINKCVT